MFSGGKKTDVDDDSDEDDDDDGNILCVGLTEDQLVAAYVFHNLRGSALVKKNNHIFLPTAGGYYTNLLSCSHLENVYVL